MEVIVQTKLLQKAMARLQRICKWHDLYIEAADSQLILKSEDKPLLCEYAVPADVLQPGVFSTGWLRKVDQLPGHSTHLITCDQNHCLTLRSEPMWLVRLVSSDSHFYPTIPKMKPVAEFGADLIAALRKLRPFYSDRARHPTLRLEGSRGEHALMVTTHYLDCGRVTGISGPEHRVKIDIPPELAFELIDAKPSRVLLLKGSKHIGASFGSLPTARIAAVLELPFSEPPQVNTVASVWFDPEQLVSVCREAMKDPLIGGPFKTSNSPTFELSFKKGSARFCFSDDEGEIEMRGVGYAGELPSSVHSSLEPNPHTLNRFLSNCDSDLIRLDFLQHEKDDYLGLSDCSGYDYRFPY